MRSIGTLPSESQARLFCDFLFARGIRNESEREGEAAWAVWIAEDEQLDAARELLERFRRAPAAPEFARASGTADRVLAEEAEANARYRRKFRTARQLFPGARSFGVGVLTYALIAACLGVAGWSRLGADRAVLEPLFISFHSNASAGFLSEVRAGEVWRLLTPMLIHFGPVHLIFNLMLLFQLGSMIEGLQGRGRFLALVVVVAVLSNLAQYAMKGPFFGGMSGVNYGLFGYAWLRGRTDPASGLFVDRQNTILLLVWLVACMTGWLGPVANWAHGAGFAVGAAWGWTSGKIAQRNPR